MFVLDTYNWIITLTISQFMQGSKLSAIKTSYLQQVFQPHLRQMLHVVVAVEDDCTILIVVSQHLRKLVARNRVASMFVHVSHDASWYLHGLWPITKF